MSTPEPQPQRGSATPLVAVIVGVVVIVCFTMASCVALFVAAPEGANTGSLITILLGNLAPTLAVLALLAKQQQTDQKVDTIGQTTHRLANGLLDAKIRAGVADVLDPAYIDETAVQQLATDRAHRDRGTNPDA